MYTIIFGLGLARENFGTQCPEHVLEVKPYCALNFLSVGLGRAGKNFGTQCPNHVGLAAEKEKSKIFGRLVLEGGAWFKFGTVSQLFFSGKECIGA